MDFEVAPRRVARGRRWAAWLPAVVALVVVVSAIGGRLLDGRDGSAHSSSPSARPASTTSVALPGVPLSVPVVGVPDAAGGDGGPATFGTDGIAGSAGLPRVVRCGFVPGADCRRALLAAIDAVFPTGDPLFSADLSLSLICGDDLDCPPTLLRQSRPVASVMLTFDDHDETWVNVLERSGDGVREGMARALVALVVRERG